MKLLSRTDVKVLDLNPDAQPPRWTASIGWTNGWCCDGHGTIEEAAAHLSALVFAAVVHEVESAPEGSHGYARTHTEESG